jgi:hypothetical protein
MQIDVVSLQEGMHLTLPKLHRRASQKAPAPKESLNEFEQRREVPVEQAIDLCVKRRAFPRRVMW